MNHEKIGYAWLKEFFNLNQVILKTESVISKISTINKNNAERHYYPAAYRPKIHTVIGHLTFALKNEPFNIHCLLCIFKSESIKTAIEQALRLNPSSKYNRLIGFYYEMLSEQILNIPKLSAGNYINAVNEQQYYVTPAIREHKFRINNNFIGNGHLSALLNRDDNLLNDEVLTRLSMQSLASYPHDLLERATRYLISMETKSSYEIESERISPSKQIKFMLAIETINNEDLTKQKLIDTLNIIKDKHYQEFDYRYQQNYLSKGGYGYTSIDYITPKPADAHALMDEWFTLREKVLSSDMPTIAKAAVLSSSFVYIHPFMDGNGRISRYIMQDTLYRTGVIALPLSIGILRDINNYYEVLNTTSQCIMKLITYNLHDDGSITVLNDTCDLYRHLCFNDHALYLSNVAQKVVTELIPQEIDKLKQFDSLYEELNNTLDLPEKDINLLTTLLINNNGQISIKKRKGALQSVHKDSLDYAEKIFMELFDPGALSPSSANVPPCT